MLIGSTRPSAIATAIKAEMLHASYRSDSKYIYHSRNLSLGRNNIDIHVAQKHKREDEDMKGNKNNLSAGNTTISHGDGSLLIVCSTRNR